MAGKNYLDGKRILIVDDEPDILETLEELLSMCEVVKASTFEEAEEQEDLAFSRTNDPVRMYLRKMGAVSLLTREGEVEIAKRIEEGERMVQAIVMTITDRQDAYAAEIGEILKKKGVRLEQDLRNEKIGFKIREAVSQKVPYMIILGDNEMESRTLAVRKRGERSTSVVSLEDYLADFQKEVSSRS